MNESSFIASSSNLFPSSPGYAWASLGLFMCFETLATFSYNVVYMYTSELFPTHSRNSVHALCSSVGRVGALLAPQTPLLVSQPSYHHHVFHADMVTATATRYG